MNPRQMPENELSIDPKYKDQAALEFLSALSVEVAAMSTMVIMIYS